MYIWIIIYWFSITYNIDKMRLFFEISSNYFLEILGSLKTFIILNTISVQQENIPPHESGLIPSLLNLPMVDLGIPLLRIRSLRYPWGDTIKYGGTNLNMWYTQFFQWIQFQLKYFSKKNIGGGVFFKSSTYAQKKFPEKITIFQKKSCIFVIYKRLLELDG